MRQQIIKDDLCARLPYGVKMKWEDSNHIMGITYQSETDYVNDLYPLSTLIYTLETHEYLGWKPLLFPSLTEPITVAGYNDGKPFIPNDEIKRINKNCSVATLNESNYHNFPHWIIDLLNQWHCNYRLLPNEFVPATNEYA